MILMESTVNFGGAILMGMKNVHTIKWKEICKPIIESEGLGIRKPDCNNIELLA